MELCEVLTHPRSSLQKVLDAETESGGDETHQLNGTCAEGRAGQRIFCSTYQKLYMSIEK